MLNNPYSYWKWPFIVSFPINSMVIFNSYVKLPDGNRIIKQWVSMVSGQIHLYIYLIYFQRGTWITSYHKTKNIPDSIRLCTFYWLWENCPYLFRVNTSSMVVYGFPAKASEWDTSSTNLLMRKPPLNFACDIPICLVEKYG